MLVPFFERVRGVWHIDFTIISTAYSIIGFMKRTCKEFNDIPVLKIIYYTLLRSELIWSMLMSLGSTYHVGLNLYLTKFIDV